MRWAKKKQYVPLSFLVKNTQREKVQCDEFGKIFFFVARNYFESQAYE